MAGPGLFDCPYGDLSWLVGKGFEKFLAVRSTTSVGALVMRFKKTKYVSKKRLQFESTLYENALCQISALDLSGLTHSDSFFCFPIVLL